MTNSGQDAGGNADSRSTQPVSPNATAQPPRPSRWRRRLKRLAKGCLVLIVIAAVGLLGAEYYTSRPAFCRSCHIMEPYYQSWTHDVHSEKVGASCVVCHYAPGERHTLRAKFRGLSQAASYFSGRSGAGRPRAHVSDASCLTSSCHGDEAYLSKTLAIGEPRVEKRLVGGREVEISRAPTVGFVHSKHLRVTSRLDETLAAMEQTRARLKASLAEPVYERVARAAVAPDPTPEREARIRGIVLDQGEAQEADALALGRLEHLKTRLEQLNGLTCAACHSYDASGRRHQAVDLQTCFTCHFSHQAFNQGTGECLACHEPPTRRIAVHEPTGTQPSTVMMDHQEIVRRNIDCASCHLDVVQGQGQVSVRECTHCHDQRRYLDGFDERTTQQVEEYHRVHVAAQRARCVDCHHGVQHRLAEPTMLAAHGGFLQVVLDNCQHCHPNHHHEQVQLLLGTGGEGATIAMPNAMFGSRINCRACHTQSGSDFKGDPLVKATASTCVACHDEGYQAILDQWIHEIAARLKETTEDLDALDKRIRQLQAQGRAIPPRVEALLSQARVNAHLLNAGNGIHNKNYALTLLDIGEAGIRQARSMLDGQ